MSKQDADIYFRPSVATENIFGVWKIIFYDESNKYQGCWNISQPYNVGCSNLLYPLSL